MLGNIQDERVLIEAIYDDTMTVIGASEREIDGETIVMKKVTLLENQPCALLFSGTPDAGEDEDSGIIRYQAMIFCAPELNIPTGCRVTVTQYGKVSTFKYSGECAMYPTHQQISVVRDERA